MPFFSSLIKKCEEKLKKKGEPMEAPPAYDPDNPPTRWEKAVMGLNGIIQQVVKIDPDGVDVICFPGVGGDNTVDVYRNVKDPKGIENLVKSREPGGGCNMGQALDQVFKDAFTRGFERPCSVLIFTAGRPEDHEQMCVNIKNAAQAIQKSEDLTLTFVQVGDDQWAEGFLKHLDENMTATNVSTGETVDIVDTVKDEDIKNAVGEMKESGFLGGGGAGALMGAFAGAAMGVGGMYLYNKIQAKKRTEGWNGQWKATFQGEEMAVLTVSDDMAGNLTIEGGPDGVALTGNYAEGEDGYNIILNPTDMDAIVGTVEDEHNISWSDGTHWEEVPPEGTHWSTYVAAGTAGASAVGGVGYLCQKKFFNKAANGVKSDYVIVMDRSQMMTLTDTGK